MFCFSFSSFRCSPGSTPAAKSTLASSRLARASFRDSCGNEPRERVFSLPPNQYAIRQSFELFGFTSGKSQPPPDNLKGLERGLAPWISTFVSGIAGSAFAQRARDARNSTRKIAGCKRTPQDVERQSLMQNPCICLCFSDCCGRFRTI
jgi:hypothetical protein